MDQATHAWLAVEAYRKIEKHAATPDGRKKKLGGLAKLLGDSLKDVVVASWLPDSLIKDMSYGHIFKNSNYRGSQIERFTVGRADLKKNLCSDMMIPQVAFPVLPKDWWEKPYRVKDGGGHLPARVNSLCQSARDMLRMGDAGVVKLTGVTSKGASEIHKDFLFTKRDIAIMLWMVSHYVADSHVPFHCDNRVLATGRLHSAVEGCWGKQVPGIFDNDSILKVSNRAILGAKLPKGSLFEGLDFGSDIKPLVNNGDPWKESVYICRASFAASYALVPPSVAAVDNREKCVSFTDLLNDESICGFERFRDISRAVMVDAAGSIARFWQDIWVDFTKKRK